MDNFVATIIKNQQMNIDIRKLKRVKTYAGEHNLTVQAIYKRIACGKLKTVDIDGMTFVIPE